MKFSVLASGSKANCSYLEANNSKILIDCGLSAKQTEIRLKRLGIDPESLNAILVSHEHSDHINGISVMSRRYKLPVYINHEYFPFIDNVYKTEIFETGKDFVLGDFKISPFSIVHDAMDPVGFCVKAEEQKFVQATDLGRVTPLLRNALKDCTALVLESNHDTEMLKECSYPWELKQRISSSHGHLSNLEAAQLIAEVAHKDLRCVVLGHLSENSNTQKCALELCRKAIDSYPECTLSCASVKQETELFDLSQVAYKLAV